MSRIKRVLSIFMVSILVIGLFISATFTAFAYETSHSGDFGATRLHYYYYDNNTVKRDKLISIRGTSFDYSIPSSTVYPDSHIDFDLELGQFSQNLSSDVDDYAVLVGRYDATLKITVLNDTQYQDHGITSFDPEGVNSYELALWDNLNRSVSIPIYDHSVDGKIIYQDYDKYIVEYDISAELNAKVPASFNWNSFACFLRLKYWTSWIMESGSDIEISGEISGGYTLTLDVLIEESINSNLSDIKDILEGTDVDDGGAASGLEDIKDSISIELPDSLPVQDQFDSLDAFVGLAGSEVSTFLGAIIQPIPVKIMGYEFDLIQLFLGFLGFLLLFGLVFLILKGSHNSGSNNGD